MNYVGLTLTVLFICLAVIGIITTIRIFKITLKYGGFYSFKSFKSIPQEERDKINRYHSIILLSFLIYIIVAISLFIIGTQIPELYTQIL